MRTIWALAFVVAAGCASAADPKAFYGTYDVNVTAFGKTDPDVVVASQGIDGSIVLYFTYGITTDPNTPNETGIHADVDGQNLEIKMQPIHVDYSTGQIDGTVVGKGSSNQAMLDLTFNVTPTNVNFVQPDGTPLAAGATIEYDITGPKQ